MTIWMIQYENKNGVKYIEKNFSNDWNRNDVEKYLRHTRQISGKIIHLRKFREKIKVSATHQRFFNYLRN